MSKSGALLAATLLVGAVAASPSDVRADDGWYFNVAPSYVTQDRDRFRFAEVATDSNDPGVVIDEPSLSYDSDGFGFRFGFGRLFESGNGVEFFVSGDSFDDRSGFSHDASDYDPADAPGGSFFDEKNPALQVVFIDGPGKVVDSAENIDRLTRGTVGLRLGIADVDLDYDSNTWEAGGDWRKQLSSDGDSRVDLFLGGRFATTDQDFRQSIVGVFKDGHDEQSSDLHESLDEWFLGPHVGVRGQCAIGDRAAFVWNLDATLYYHDADFDGRQELAQENAEFTATAQDDETDWTPRFSAGFGFRWAVGERAWLGLSYGFDWWSDVAEIRNPEIELAEIDSDMRWVADEAAHLVGEDLTTHRLSFTIAW
jgi:hypothetical protein